MKHTLKITIILIAIFLITQLVGLYTVNKYIEVGEDDEGQIIVIHANTTLGETQELPEEQKSGSFLVILIAILIMSALILLLIKFKLGHFWRYGFALAVFFALAVVFGVYVNKYIALAAALVLAYFKVFKPNVYIHNLVEIFIYAGITILILPFLNLVSAIGLLILISVYDMIAVWKSKHMIKLAKFQSESKAFAGLAIPYHMPKIGFKKAKNAKGKVRRVKGGKLAILGGGDIGFTLIFSAVVMEHLIMDGVAKQAALGYAMIVALGATLGLILLFWISKKNKFYPAMPFISAGCLLGFGLVMLLI